MFMLVRAACRSKYLRPEPNKGRYVAVLWLVLIEYMSHVRCKTQRNTLYSHFNTKDN